MHLLQFPLADTQAENFVIKESNSSRTYVEVLRGRDGRPGRDGKQGPRGPPGKEGNQGKQGHPGLTGTNCGGATYTRWGHSGCPDVMNTSIVYSGLTAGSHFSHKGGGANYICLVKDPEYTLKNGPREKTYIYGTEYESPILGTHDTNAPCAVCHVSTRSSMIMIPGKTTCPQDWTREYYGYIMTAYHEHHRSMYVCVDMAMEPIPGSSPNHNGALFYHVEAVCGVGLPCPPYDNRKEINCAVCTK